MSKDVFVKNEVIDILNDTLMSTQQSINQCS